MNKFTQLISAFALLLSLCGCNSVISDNTESVSERTEYDLSFKDEDLDEAYSSATYINLSDEDVKITKEGTYVLTGDSNASIIVDVSKKDEVKLVLNGVNITSDDFAAIYVAEADKVTITLAEGSENYLSDSDTYTQIDENEVDGVIYSKGDLVINGKGSLNIEANYANGIVSKDDLIITDGTINVNAPNGKGIVGKDCVKIMSAEITVDSLEDAIRSNNDEDAYRGYIFIASGKINVSSSGDGIYAYNMIEIDDGEINVVTKTDSANDSDSLKGIKAGSMITVNGGTIVTDTEDDSIHCDGDVYINGGNITISSGDDGIHANTNLAFNGGTVNVLKSYEGLEGQYITINGGDISVVASDDGLNAADSSTSSGNSGNDFDFKGNRNAGTASTRESSSSQTTNDSNLTNGSDATPPEMPDNADDADGTGDNMTPPEKPEGSGMQDFDPSSSTPREKPTGDSGSTSEAMPMAMEISESTDSASGQTMMMGMGGASTDAVLTINGGTLYVNAGGDGLDSNGTIVINGGQITVDGPSDSSNCALDYETSGNIYGGEIILVGSSGMAESFSSDSTQCNLLYNLSTTYSAGTKISVLDKNGEEILSMTSAKSFNSLMLSSSSISDGDTITIIIGNDTLTYTFDGICNTSGSSAGFGGGNGGFGKTGGMHMHGQSQSTTTATN